MKKTLQEINNEFELYFNENAPKRIEEIMKIESRGLLHNTFCDLRIEYILELTKRYSKNSLYSVENDIYAEKFVNKLLNQYLDDRKKKRKECNEKREN